MSEIFQFDPHIRAIHLREDLKQIADLIELCFIKNIDTEGKDYISNIRKTANNIGGFILENTTPETSPLPFHGYVWVDHGIIIGNLTLIPIRSKEKGSYFVANIAVHPDHRGKGISKQLTERAIQHVREHQGHQIYLQVKDDNAPAIHIYNDIGFTEVSRRTMWVYRSKDHTTGNKQTSLRITSREKEDWAQQKLWLDALYPKEIRWNIPFRIEKLEPTFSNWLRRLLYGEYQRTWSARKNSKLIGTVTMERNNEIHDYLWLASSPIWENEVIQTVFPVIQKRAFFPRRLAVNYPAGRAKDSFESVGMQELNTLLWMKRKIYPVHEAGIA